MVLWKQIIVSLCLVIAVAAAAALWLPGARPLLRAAGLERPMQVIGLIRDEGEAPAGDGRGPAVRTPKGVPVIAVPPGRVAMDTRIEAIGTTRGIRSVTVAAERTGRITALGIRSGQRVEAGQLLVQIDDAAARIAVERARVSLDYARNELGRMRRLEESGSGTVQQRLDAELALRNAELALTESERVLAQHRIEAPVAGWVGIVTLEPGDLLASGVEITTIEDRSRLLVDFRVPERLVAQIAQGDAVHAAPLADPAQLIAGRITALDNRVEAASRTLRVQAEVENPGDRLRAGMALRVGLNLPGEMRTAVDPMAVQWGTGSAYVWVVRDGKAATVSVQILQRNSDVVLVDAALEPGDLVVVEGVVSLRTGSEVSVQPGPST
ncbi:efflux RND transporter periplasmic adaptor subunit [Frigidibacter sp. MR17.24]|uniref:efflux RND transporter periplasmic adaptor subunit n=1 Tax=Frigidibacter sp. MR17.24 TaxID=3127345 RepID=UPI00301311B8